MVTVVMTGMSVGGTGGNLFLNSTVVTFWTRTVMTGVGVHGGSVVFPGGTWGGMYLFDSPM